jgi:hypothetical protein
MSGGTILIDRALFDHPLVGAHNPKYYIAWTWLLMEARWKDCRKSVGGEVVDIRRGQVPHSVSFMAEGCNLSRQQMRTFIKHLKSNQMVNHELTNGQTMLTICNYDKYQVLGNKSNHKTTSPVTSEQPACNQPVTTTIIPEAIPEEIPDKVYAYKCDWFRLTEKDYNKAKEDYGFLKDLDGELFLCDLYYRDDPPKKPFFTVMSWLRRTNDRLKADSPHHSAEAALEQYMADVVAGRLP